MFFSPVIFLKFYIFGHQNHGSEMTFSLKCWIRIRIKWIRIRNTCLIVRLSAIWMGVYDPTFPRQIASGKLWIHFPILIVHQKHMFYKFAHCQENCYEKISIWIDHFAFTFLRFSQTRVVFMFVTFHSCVDILDWRTAFCCPTWDPQISKLGTSEILHFLNMSRIFS